MGQKIKIIVITVLVTFFITTYVNYLVAKDISFELSQSFANERKLVEPESNEGGANMNYSRSDLETYTMYMNYIYTFVYSTIFFGGP